MDKTPDIQQSLQNQGELMSAMRDAGEAVARRIGDVADAKRDALLQAASESDDPQQKQQYLAEAEQWGESGHYRVGLQSAGGSLVGGIGGGLLGAAQSGAGSLVSALLAHKLDAVSRQIADQKPTGNADLDKTLGNIVANVMSSVAGGVVGGTQGAQAAYNVDRFNRQLHQDADPRKDERKRIEQDIAPAYAAAHAGMTVEEATDRLAAQLLRQVDTTAASQGGWDQDASNYLNAYAATHPGETIGKDQWDNAVPLFGTASGYQRNDSTIFSAAPQTTDPPPQLGLGAVGGYLAGMEQGLADTIGHPLDTLWGGVKGAYGFITDPQGTAQQMQAATRDVLVQAGDGNFVPAGQQVGQQVGSTVIGTVVGVGAGKAVAGIEGRRALTTAKITAADESIGTVKESKTSKSHAIGDAQVRNNFYRDGIPYDIRRIAYEADAKRINDAVSGMRATGIKEEAIAKWAVDQRNNLKIRYRDISPPEFVKAAEARNMEKYGNPLGPTVDQLRSKGLSWRQIADSAASPGGKIWGLVRNESED